MLACLHAYALACCRCCVACAACAGVCALCALCADAQRARADTGLGACSLRKRTGPRARGVAQAVTGPTAHRPTAPPAMPARQDQGVEQGRHRNNCCRGGCSSVGSGRPLVVLWVLWGALGCSGRPLGALGCSACSGSLTPCPTTHCPTSEPDDHGTHNVNANATPRNRSHSTARGHKNIRKARKEPKERGTTQGTVCAAAGGASHEDEDEGEDEGEGENRRGERARRRRRSSRAVRESSTRRSLSSLSSPSLDST